MILMGARDFSLLQNKQTSFRAHLAPCLITYWEFFTHDLRNHSMKLTTDLHLLPWLRMSTAIRPLPLCLHGFTGTLPSAVPNHNMTQHFRYFTQAWICSYWHSYIGSFSLHKYAVQNQIMTITFWCQVQALSYRDLLDSDFSIIFTLF
jgi:hypothetical protein